MNGWAGQVAVAAFIGVASGAISARITVAVLATDVSWIKQQVQALWKRLDKVEDRMEQKL